VSPLRFTQATNLVLTIGLGIGLLLLEALGRWLGQRRPDPNAKGPSAIDGALLGLLSLVLAFTFSAANSRFDYRRQLIMNETNAIDTAWLRIDLLSPDAQPAIRDDFRQYVDARLAAYNAQPDMAETSAQIDRAKAIEGDIWRRALVALQPESATPSRMLVVNALNAMFDMESSQGMALRLHPPLILYVTLALLALLSAVVVGEITSLQRERWWFRSIAFAALYSLMFFLILELEHPRVGFIRIEDFDDALIALRHAMG
jgi:hypothetical protein